MSKRITLTIAIILLLAIGVYLGFLKKEKPVFSLAEVVRGNVSQEVSGTGTVKKGDEINLSFKNTGRIEKIYVVVGEEVKEGDILAKLENNQLKIQLQEDKAALDLAKAKLDKLLAGASLEEIQIAKTNVSNAQISLNSAKQNLEDIKTQGEENLKSAYEDALNILDDASLKIFNALNTIDSIQRTYFTKNDQESTKVEENKNTIESSLNQAKLYLEEAKTSNKNEDIDTALSEMRNTLNKTSAALKVIRETCEEINYKSIISSTDKSSLDTHRGNINTALTNVVNSQQTIISTKLTNATNINTYQAKVDTAQGELKAAEDELAKILAPPRQEDVTLYKSEVKQAEAQVSLLENQIEDTILRSPVEGQIAKVNKRVGEIIQPALVESFISIIPAVPLQIKVDVYEEDVVKLSIGNPVDITLTAYPNQILKGKVVAIDPAEKIINNVVYYETTIGFENVSEKMKTGMTADVVIKTQTKENVLTVPDAAIQTENGKTFVQVLVGKKTEQREIEVGLKGSNGAVEVISGLEEGEKVITK